MTDDTMLPFSFPAVHAKKVTAAFDGGRLTSNGGVMLLAMAERRLCLADNLARVFPDRRDPTRVVHSLVDMFRARMSAMPTSMFVNIPWRDSTIIPAIHPARPPIISMENKPTPGWPIMPCTSSICPSCLSSNQNPSEMGSVSDSRSSRRSRAAWLNAQ
jgi:hypothetical protein